MRAARAAASSELLTLYWSIGETSWTRQLGEQVTDRLADLRVELPDHRECHRIERLGLGDSSIMSDDWKGGQWCQRRTGLGRRKQ